MKDRILKAIYPGSFDPLTLGHADIIRRAARVAESLTVAVLDNPAKTPLFSAKERVKFLTDEICDLGNVTAVSFSGMLAEYVFANDIGLIVRGVRNYADFEYESTMAIYNRRLSGGVDTWFIPCDPALAHISAGAVREIAGLRAADMLSELVPQKVKEELISRM